MTTQPEALRLADWLDAHANGPMAAQKQAAAELRRLHAVNEELLGVLKWLDNWLGEKPMVECSRRISAAIAKATGEQA